MGTITVKSPLGTVTPGTALSQGQYIDGTYEGSAQGYRGTVTVQVKVSGGMISSITVESYRDDDEFFNRAKDTVINAIIAGQTTDVQAVSGATYSSRGIMQAVANALGVTTSPSENTTEWPQENRQQPDNGGKSKKHRSRSDDSQSSERGAKPDSKQSPNDQTNTEQNANLDFSGLSNGTYSGTGKGRNGDIKVSVKVKGGKVTSITIESSSEDAKYFDRAKDTVIGEIIDSQSLNVQTVSGATMSSNGIIDAVANALGISYTNPNSQQGAKGSQHSNQRGRGGRH